MCHLLVLSSRFFCLSHFLSIICLLSLAVVFFHVSMAWDVGPVATEALTHFSALRHSLSASVILIYPKLFWLIKSSLKLLICGCAAPEVSEDAGSRSSPPNPFRIPLHLTLIKYWLLLLWQLAQLPAAILFLFLLFFSFENWVFYPATAWLSMSFSPCFWMFVLFLSSYLSLNVSLHSFFFFRGRKTAFSVNTMLDTSDTAN